MKGLPMNILNAVRALIRTLMPFVYSSVAAVIAHFGYHVSLATVIQIVGGGFVGLTVVLHALEAKFPWIGVLLGWIGAPTYPPSAKVKAQAYTASLEARIAEFETVKSEAAAPSAPTASATEVSAVTQ